MKIKKFTNFGYLSIINNYLKRIYLNRCLDIKTGLNFYNRSDDCKVFNGLKTYCIFYSLLGKTKKSDFKNSNNEILNFFNCKSIDRNFFSVSSPFNNFINILSFYQNINNLSFGKSIFISVYCNNRFLSSEYFFYIFYNYKKNFDTLLGLSFVIKRKFQFVRFSLSNNLLLPLK